MPRPYHRTVITKPRKGSINDRISKLEVGGCLYLEFSDTDKLRQTQRYVCLSAHRPESMKDMKFTTSTFTAVEATGLKPVKYLLRVERIE